MLRVYALGMLKNNNKRVMMALKLLTLANQVTVLLAILVENHQRIIPMKLDNWLRMSRLVKDFT